VGGGWGVWVSSFFVFGCGWGGGGGVGLWGGRWCGFGVCCTRKTTATWPVSKLHASAPFQDSWQPLRTQDKNDW